MGQNCSRRKQSEPAPARTIPSSPTPPPPPSFSPLTRVADFWRSKNIPEPAIVGLGETFWSTEEIVSIRLSYPDETLESFISENSFDLFEVKFPVEFDFFQHSKYIFGSPIWGTQVDRMKVSELSLNTISSWMTLCGNSRLEEQMVVNQALALLAMITRNFLGKKPSRSFPTLLDDSVLSPHVSILVATYRFLNLWSLLSVKLVDFFSSSINEIVTLLLDEVDVDKLGVVLNSVRMVQGPDKNTNYRQGIFYTFLVNWAEKQAQLDDIISAHLLKKSPSKIVSVLHLSKPSVSDRIIQNDKKFVQLVLDYIYSPSTLGSNMQVFEELYQMLPVRGEVGNTEWDALMDRADEFEVHFGIARILVSFFKMKNLNFCDLKKLIFRRELFVFHILAAVGKLARSTEMIFDLWWSDLLENFDRCVGNGFDEVVVDYLVSLVFEIEFDTHLLVDPITIERVIESVCVRSNIDLSRIVNDRFLSSEFEDPIRWTRIFSRPLYARCCQPLVERLELKIAVEQLALSGRVSVSTSSQAGGGFINALSSKINQQLGTGGWSRNRLVEMRAQLQFFPVNFLSVLEPICVFRKIFEFNPLAFLDTQKVQTVCRFLQVEEGSDAYAFVLHCACVAYLMVGEVDGGLSIVDRLLFEYGYAEAWRLVRQLVRLGTVNVPSNILLKAVEVCPIEEIEDLLPKDVGERLVKRTGLERREFDPIGAFPNLGDDKAVDEYIACIGGDAIGISYQSARILAIQESLVNVKEGDRNLIDGIRMGSIRVS